MEDEKRIFFKRTIKPPQIPAQIPTPVPAPLSIFEIPKQKSPILSTFVEKPLLSPEVQTAEYMYDNFLDTNKSLSQSEILNNAIQNEELLKELVRRYLSLKKVALIEKRNNIQSPLTRKNLKMSLTGPLSKTLDQLSYNYQNIVSKEEYVQEVKQYQGICKVPQMMNVPKRPDFKPLQHQILAREWLKNFNSILLFHGLGSGKTCEANLVIEDYLNENPDNFVYFISPGGLRRNAVEEFCTFCPYDRRSFFDDKNELKIRFLSSDDTTLMNKISEFSDCLIVVDEAHHLNSSQEEFEDDSNDVKPTKNMKKLYDLLISRKNSKLLLMSGTPMEKKISDHYCMLSLLKPEEVNSLENFKNNFKLNNEKKLIPIDEPKVGEIYSNCISFYKTPEEFLPKVTEEIVKLELNEEIAGSLTTMVEREFFITSIGLMRLKLEYQRKGMSAFAALNKAKIDIFKASTHDTSSRNSLIVYPEEVETEFELFEKLGKSPQSYVNYMFTYSAKLFYLYNYLMNPNNEGKHMIYTPFKTGHGSVIISDFLNFTGISNVVYSGDLSSDNARSKILINFNSPDNLNGEKIKVIIVTNAGNEGLTLLAVRHVHILHQYIFEPKIKQVIGRSIRYKSHQELPPEKRNVKVLRYFGGDPDEVCYRKAKAKEIELEIMNKKVIDEYCIENSYDISSA
jgi:hypothetical protein